MPNLDFYAVGQDFEPVLDFVFGKTGCRVFESYSELDKDIREFKSLSDLSRAYQIGECVGSSESVHLQLVPPGADALYCIERITLQPSTGNHHRYTIKGWGLIQLYLGGLSSAGVVHSHTNHNSEKRALAWQDTIRDLGPVVAWDWKQVVRTSSALNRFVRTKLAFHQNSNALYYPKLQRLLKPGTNHLASLRSSGFRFTPPRAYADRFHRRPV